MVWCLTLATILVSWGCADLSVDNLNAPDTRRVLEGAATSPDDVVSLLAGGYVTWWQRSTHVHGWMAVNTMGDQFTSSWGNFAMRELSSEPREAYNNSLTASSDTRNVTEYPWYGYYSSLQTASDVINLIKGGVVIGSAERTKAVEASAYLLQGLSLGQLGLLFDQAFIIDEDSDPLNPPGLSPYGDVIEAAISKLEKAKQTADAAGSAVMPGSLFNGYQMSMGEMKQLANSFAARFLTYQARTAAENGQTDWGRVLTYANNGIDWDFAPEGDDQFWYSYILLYGNLAGWIRVDQRVIHMFDESQPERYPDNTSEIAEADSDDARVEEYFSYSTAIPFPSDRGYYHFSHYTRVRYAHHSFALATGPMPFFLKAENNLIRAEALLRTSGSQQTAADLINESRTEKGQLAPVGPSDDLMHALYYERFAEIDYAGPGQGYFDRRRTDVAGFEIQPGTPRHMPVPARELNLLDMDIYTFGGSAGKRGQYLVSLHAQAAPPASIQVDAHRSAKRF